MTGDRYAFRQRFNRWKQGERYWSIIGQPLPHYADGKDSDLFYKNLYPKNIDTSEYDFAKKAWNYDDQQAMKFVHDIYQMFPDHYEVYAGELPEVVVKPDPNSKSQVTLTTYYPMVSAYPYTGHSKLKTEGGNIIDVKSNDVGYNLITNNCSDATRKALEMASGKKMNNWFFTTPGDVKDFAELLGGRTSYPGYGRAVTKLDLPTEDVRKIAEYSKKLSLEKYRQRFRKIGPVENNGQKVLPLYRGGKNSKSSFVQQLETQPTVLQPAVQEWGDMWKERMEPAAKSKVLLKWNATGRKPKPETSQEYTNRRIKETTERTWRSDAADIAHGIGEGVLALNPYTAIPYYGAKVGQDVLSGNVNWNTALNASVPLFHLSPQAVGLREATNAVLEDAANAGSKTARNWRVAREINLTTKSKPKYTRVHSKNLFRTLVYKGGEIADPYSNFITTDPLYAANYGKVTPYIFESKSIAKTKEPMMGYIDPVSLDMFIYNNTKRNPNATAIIGHDAVTGEFTPSKGIEILNMNPKNLYPVRTLDFPTSLKFFERKPSRISQAEREGIPKGERNLPFKEKQLTPAQWTAAQDAAVARGTPVESEITSSWIKELPLDERRYYRQVRPDALDSYRANGVVSQFNKYGHNPTGFDVPMFSKGHPTLHRESINSLGDIWIVSKPKANLEWESVNQGAAMSPKFGGEFNKAPISEFDFYQYDPARGYFKLNEELTNNPFSKTPHVDYLNSLSEQQQIGYLTLNGLNDQWLWTLKNKPEYLESALRNAPIPDNSSIRWAGSAKGNSSSSGYGILDYLRDDKINAFLQGKPFYEMDLGPLGMRRESFPSDWTMTKMPFSNESKEIINNSAKPRILAQAEKDIRDVYDPTIDGPDIEKYVKDELSYIEKQLDEKINEGYELGSDALFKAHDEGKTATRTGGLQLTNNGRIVLREGENPEEFAVHEWEHRRTNDNIGGSHYGNEKRLLRKAFTKEFRELSETVPDFKGMHMDDEMVTTVSDTREALIGKAHLRKTAPELQNKMIDKSSDEKIFAAVEKANVYGYFYIQKMRELGKLTPELAQNIREALKHVGAYTAPIGVGYGVYRKLKYKKIRPIKK